MLVDNDGPASSQKSEKVLTEKAALTALTHELQQVKQQLKQEQIKCQILEAKLDKLTTHSSESEAFFRQLFEKSSDAHLLMQEGRFTDCNWAAVAMLGCESKAQLLSLHLAAISPKYQPDGRLSFEKANEMIATVLQQGNVRFEWMYHHLNGNDCWVEVLLDSIEVNGQPLIHVTLRDIDAYKLTETALQQKEIQYRSIFEAINDGLFISDLDTEKVVTVNPATCKMHGYTEEEFTQLVPSEFIHADSMPQFAAFMAATKAGKRFTCEAVDIRKDGTLIDIEVTGIPFPYNGTSLALACVRDISDRKAAERTLAESEAYHRSLFEKSTIGLALCRMDGQLIYVNSAYCDILGRSLEEVQALTYWEITPTKYSEAEQFQLESLRTKGHYGPYEKEYIHKAGHLVPVRLSGTIVERNGERLIWSSVEDISDRKGVEKQLKEVNGLLNSVLETIPGFFFAKDLQGRHIALNSNLAEFFSRSIADILGKTDADLLPPDVAASIMAKDQEIIHTQVAQRFEEVIPTHGTDHTYLTVKTPLYDPNGHVAGLIGLAQDITDRKEMETALRQSEQRFRDVTEAAGEYIWEIAIDGTYTFITEQAKDVKGYDPAELLGHTPFEFMPEEDVAHVGSIIQTAASQKSAFTLEHRDILPNGEIVWEAVSGVPLLSAQDRIIGFRGTGLSITERKATEAILAESEAKFRKKANELEATLQALQKTQMQMIQSEKMSSLGQLVAGVAHEINNPVNFIYGNIKPLEQYAQDMLHLIKLYQTHYPETVPDIQEEINAIELDFLQEDLPKTLASMKLGADRIREIIRSLRTFSRLDEAICKAVDVHAGIDSCLVILAHRFKTTDLRPAIRVVKQYGDLPLVECYAGQLNQVLMNILANALDALEEQDRDRSFDEMKRLPSTITIATQTISPEWIAIHLTDNGPGIPDFIQPRIFDPFFTTKPVGQGTGMGMSISYQIITENHSGKLECISSPAKGTTFVIKIPIYQPNIVK